MDSNHAKRELAERLLTMGTVMLVLDARHEGVRVPQHLTGDPKLRLNIDYRFGADMTVSDAGAEATLSFAGAEFDCILPWEAVYVMLSHGNGQPHVFPDDVPREVLDEIGIEPGPKPPALHVIANDGSEPDVTPTARPPSEPPDAAPESDSDPPPAKRRAHLRVVK